MEQYLHNPVSMPGIYQMEFIGSDVRRSFE
jgi:hypothetical protein